MKLTAAERLRPGPAPVNAASDFASIEPARSIDWAVAPEALTPPPGGGRIVIELGGRWDRKADEGDWRKVVVPDNFGYEDPEFSDFFGPMWYRRKFADPRVDAPDGSPQHARLGFAAVDYFADVWLNDELLGHHEGSFAPFGFDVTDRLQKNNEVLVRVQDPVEPLDPNETFLAHKKRIIKGALKYHDSRPGGMPGRMAGTLAGDDTAAVWSPEWGQSMTTAGIVGPVTLTRTGVLGIDSAFVTPLDPAGRVQIAIVLTNHGADPVAADLHLAVGDDRTTLSLTVPPGPGRVDAIAELAGLEPWEPVHSPRGRPALHHLGIVAVVDERVTDRREVTFGLRTAHVVAGDDGRARHFEVNGQPVFVKAVNYIPWQHFAEVGRSFYDRDMRMIAEAHGNAIGVHTHVQSPHAYAAADAAGILTFQDFPLQWFYDSGTETNPGFVEEAQHQIAEMAYLLHAHPSVVYYACHNEPLRMFVPTKPEDDEPERDAGERHLDAALLSTLQSIDDSRHVHEASGIGDDVHSYLGSLSGRNLYRVSELPAWFVSEYGFWTVGPQAAKFGDTGWPPTPEQMREWVSRLSFFGSTVRYAGLPQRYPSLADWGDATEAYGAALAKHQTEWFRIHRGAPFMGYRWHFWSDWWGYAGGGLVDLERVPKRTYDAFRAASRPVLVTARTDRSVYEPGEARLPVFVVNDTHEAWRGPIRWEVRDATSSVISPDPDGFRTGVSSPDDGAAVAVPRGAGEIIDAGTLPADAPAESSTPVGELTVALDPGTARTVVFRWGDETNFVHLHCPAVDASYPPGLLEVP